MKKFIYLVFVVAFTFSLLSGDLNALQGKKYKLEYKMAQGTKFSISAFHEYERETILPDGNLTGNTIVDKFEGHFQVESNDPANGMILGMEILKLHREKINPGGTFLNDFTELAGTKLSFGLSPSGEIFNLEGFKSLPQQDLFLRVSAPDHFLHRIHSSFPILPETPVAIGDTWTSTLEAVRPWGELEVKITSKNTYKVLEETQLNGIDCLKIEVNIIQSSKAEGERWGRQVSAEYEGSGKETIYFALAQGMVLQKEGSMEVKGRLMQSDQTDNVKYGWQVKFEK